MIVLLTPMTAYPKQWERFKESVQTSLEVFLKAPLGSVLYLPIKVSFRKYAACVFLNKNLKLFYRE